MDSDLQDPFDLFVKRLMDFGLENTVARRYYSKYAGLVTDTADPSQEGRVKVVVSVTGFDQPLALWAIPSSPFAGADRGLYFPPEVGDVVWVWFDHGDPTQPNYSGGWWTNPDRTVDSQEKPETSSVPTEFKTTGSPTTRGIKTKAGLLLFEDSSDRDPRVEIATISQGGLNAAAAKHHVLVLSDKPGDERVTITTTAGLSMMMHDPSFSIKLATPQSRSLVLSDQDQKASLETSMSKVELLDVGPSLTLQTQGLMQHQAQALQAVYQNAEWSIQAAATMKTVGALTLMATAGAVIVSGLTLQLVSATVVAGILLGTGAVLRLVTETLLAIFNANVLLYNSHTHPVTTVGVGNLGAPVASTGLAGVTSTPMGVANVDDVVTRTTRAL